MNPPRRFALVGMGFVLAGCVAATSSGAGGPAVTPAPTPVPSPSFASSSVPPINDIWAFEPLGPIDPGTYVIDPDRDASTPLRVVYEVPEEGWSQWMGAVRFSDVGHVAVSITSVVNLVREGCTGHIWADPPVGPGVEDLATALTKLAPFEVTTPPEDVTIYGHRGRHLVWSVPDLPVSGSAGSDRPFTECIGGQLKSWVSPVDTLEIGDAFYGYTGPGYTEEIWILDVEGARLMIAAETSADSPVEDIAERDAILDSIVIEPS